MGWSLLGMLAGCAHGASLDPLASSATGAVDGEPAFAPGVPASAADSREIARGFAIGAAAVIGETDVEAGRCLRVDVGITDGVVDADLAAFAVDGVRLAADESPSRFAAIAVCSESAARIHLQATASRGAGEVALRVTPITHEALRRAGLADAAISTGRIGSDEELRRRAVAEFGARGYRIDAGPLPIALDPAVPSQIGVPVRAGECVVVSARARAGSATLRLSTATGQLLADDAGEARDLSVSFCSVENQTLVASLSSASTTSAAAIVLRGVWREVGGRSSIAAGRDATTEPPDVPGGRPR